MLRNLSLTGRTLLLASQIAWAISCGKSSPAMEGLGANKADVGVPMDVAGANDAPQAATATSQDNGPLPCADIYAQDLLPTFQLELTPDEFAKLYAEFKNVPQTAHPPAGVDIHTYHAAVFRYNAEVYPDAMVRLRAQSSWRQSAALDTPGKMQFVVAFDMVNPKGRFHGLQHVALDMPRADTDFLSVRLTAAYLRKLGLPAQCANSARVELNGAYYGLFANQEHLDSTWAHRVFPGAGEGNLWKNGVALDNHMGMGDHTKRDQFYAVTTLAELQMTSDVSEAMAAWAGEAVAASTDSEWAAGDFYLYEHPTRGFLRIPYDMDTAFSQAPVNADPIGYSVVQRMRTPGVQWDLMMANPTLRSQYVAQVKHALDLFDVAEIQQEIDTWSAQIADSVASDPNKPMHLTPFPTAIATLRAWVPMRAAFLSTWVSTHQ